MKKSVKTLAILTSTLFLFNVSYAQLKLPVTTPLGNDLKKIVADYPNHFTSFVGELLVENAQSTDFACNCKVTGAEETIVTLHSSKGNSIYSWQTVMLTTENFEEAKQKYKSLYNQLNNLALNPTGEKSYRLRGKYESPVAEKKFSSVLFSFDPVDESVTKLKAELSLQFYPPMEWKVKILFYDREREDDERGSLTEEDR